MLVNDSEKCMPSDGNGSGICPQQLLMGNMIMNHAVNAVNNACPRLGMGDTGRIREYLHKTASKAASEWVMENLYLRDENACTDGSCFDGILSATVEMPKQHANAIEHISIKVMHKDGQETAISLPVEGNICGRYLSAVNETADFISLRINEPYAVDIDERFVSTVLSSFRGTVASITDYNSYKSAERLLMNVIKKCILQKYFVLTELVCGGPVDKDRELYDAIIEEDSISVIKRTGIFAEIVYQKNLSESEKRDFQDVYEKNLKALRHQKTCMCIVKNKARDIIGKYFEEADGITVSEKLRSVSAMFNGYCRYTLPKSDNVSASVYMVSDGRIGYRIQNNKVILEDRVLNLAVSKKMFPEGQTENI